MPSGPPELHAKWKDDGNACRFLEAAGYKLRPEWLWDLPPGKTEDQVTAEEYEAMAYLVWEWDYGYIYREPK